jgi:hypothetical protein
VAEAHAGSPGHGSGGELPSLEVSSIFGFIGCGHGAAHHAAEIGGEALKTSGLLVEVLASKTGRDAVNVDHGCFQVREPGGTGPRAALVGVRHRGVDEGRGVWNGARSA